MNLYLIIGAMGVIERPTDLRFSEPLNEQQGEKVKRLEQIDTSQSESALESFNKFRASTNGFFSVKKERPLAFIHSWGSFQVGTGFPSISLQPFASLDCNQ